MKEQALKLAERASHRPAVLLRNVRRYLRAATPEQIERGSGWYAEANQYAAFLAASYGCTLIQAAAVLAALSPAVGWRINKIDAATVCDAHRQGYDADSVIVSTYGKQKAKAFAILDAPESEAFSLLGNGPKTVNFARNIAFPACTEAVTVDRHALGMAVNSTRNAAHLLVNLTAKRYRNIAEAIRRAAIGTPYTPAQVQAIVWIVYRENVRPERYTAHLN